MPFDTISGPQKSSEVKNNEPVKISGWHAEKKVRQKRLNLGTLSVSALIFVVLGSSYLTITKPHTVAATEGLTTEETVQEEQSGNVFAQGIQLDSFDQVTPQKNKILKVLPLPKIWVIKVVQKGGFEKVYREAEKKYGVPWQILAAVHFVETHQSGDTAVSSYAGAQGPMQFMPGTFNAYKQDGDGDGKMLIYDVHDAIFAAANNLARNGAADGRIRKALYNYNHSYAYVEKVLAYARGLGFKI